MSPNRSKHDDRDLHDPEYLGIFHCTYPGIDLHVISANTSDIVDLMLAHQVEIALVEGPVEDENLLSEDWRTDVMSLFVASDHRFAATSRPTDCGLLTNEILIVREPGTGHARGGDAGARY